jgi:U3 small nucleolar RNA-associated protein 12
MALSNNAIEVYTIPTPVKSKEGPEATRLHSLDLHGHRTDIRTVSLSADEQLLASASNGEPATQLAYHGKKSRVQRL